MKLTTEQLKQMIREIVSESDDFDMGAHVRQKRMDRMRRGEPDRRVASPADSGEQIDLSYEEKVSKAHAAAEKALQVMRNAFPDMGESFFEAEKEKLISAMMKIV